jgi:hypothetical protein
MAKNGNPYPVFKDSTAQPKPSRGGSNLGSVILGVIGGVALLFILAIKVCGGSKDPEREARGSAPTCDERGPQSREEWLNTKEKKFDDASPYASGFRVAGSCNEKLESRNLKCDRATVFGEEHDSPFVKAAAAIGFTTYVCVDISNNDKRTEFPIAEILN